MATVINRNLELPTCNQLLFFRNVYKFASDSHHIMGCHNDIECSSIKTFFDQLKLTIASGADKPYSLPRANKRKCANIRFRISSAYTRSNKMFTCSHRRAPYMVFQKRKIYAIYCEYASAQFNFLSFLSLQTSTVDHFAATASLVSHWTEKRQANVWLPQRLTND